jgi:hypothetical protein
MQKQVQFFFANHPEVPGAYVHGEHVNDVCASAGLRYSA